jgi:PH (Pleckstrin Homology) domain-containing protein
MSGPDEVTLPHTWRPFGVRVAGAVAGALLLILVVGVWIAFSDDQRARFSLLQRGSLVGIGVIGFVAWYALIRSRVSADPAGVTVVNGYRRRTFEWSQVVAVTLRRGAPWAAMDLSDGTTIPVMGIQGSDGQRAVRALRQLRRALAEHSRTDRDD